MTERKIVHKGPPCLGGKTSVKNKKHRWTTLIGHEFFEIIEIREFALYLLSIMRFRKAVSLIIAATEPRSRANPMTNLV